MTNIWEVAKNTIREMLYRKHYYVLAFILVIIFIGFSKLQFFQMGDQTKFIRHVPMLGLPFFGVILMIFAAARQIPHECENRTLYPLLAKPLQRWEFLTGKYFGVVIMVSGSMLLIALVFWLLMTGSNIVNDTLYWQATAGFILQLAIFGALVLLLSTVMSHAATVTMSFLLYYLLCSLGPYIEDILWKEQLTSGASYIFNKIILTVIPRLDLLNLSWAVRHDAFSQGWHVMIPLFFYSVIYTIILLSVASFIFKKKEI